MGTLNEDLTAIKAVEDKLTANQVAKFAYTQHAYDNPLTEADGVTAFNPENPQNIPLGRADILKVNPSVLQYGWRAQASAITRMLMNHFLGRVSYNLNKLNDNMSSLLTTVLSHLGTANGIATLDADGRIPYSQLPESAMELKGYWNAETNTPTLADGTGTSGDFYFVDVAGTRDLGSGEQYFAVGDRVLYDGVIWKNISSGNIKTINNRAPTATGNIDLTKSDVGLSNVDNTADSNMPVENGTTKFTTGGAHNMLTSLAPAFDATVSYSQGTIVSYQGRLYRCTTDHTGAWSDNDFAIANLNEGVGTSNVTGVKGEAESSYRSGNVNISMTDLIKNFKIIAGVPFLNYLGRKWKQVRSLEVIHPRYFNGLWFAKSYLQEGTYISEDAEHWTKVAEETLTVFMYAGGLFIAEETNNLWWSEDGKVWTKGEIIGDTPTFSYYLYAEDKLSLYQETLGIYELCADNGIFYSEDGKTWQQGSFANATLPIDFRTTSIVASDTIIVAGDNNYSRIWWSEDGKIWTSVTFTNSDIYHILDIWYADGDFFCNVNAQGLWHSTNGKTWSQYSYTSGSLLLTADYKLYYNRNIKVWIAVIQTDTNVAISWFNKDAGWSSIGDMNSSNHSLIRASGLTRVIVIGSGNLVQKTAKVSYGACFISDTTFIVSTDIGLFEFALSLMQSVGNGLALGSQSVTSNIYTNDDSNASYRAPRMGGASFASTLPLIKESSGLRGNVVGSPVRFSIITFDNVTILYALDRLDGESLPENKYNTEIIISYDYGKTWKRSVITKDIHFFDSIPTIRYGGGTLVVQALAIDPQIHLSVVTRFISNFDTAVEYIKEMSVGATTF